MDSLVKIGVITLGDWNTIVVLVSALLAECHAVDEVKDLRDKSLALERYAAQANNLEAERKAVEIRLRAERKYGQLLKGSTVCLTWPQ